MNRFIRLLQENFNKIAVIEDQRMRFIGVEKHDDKFNLLFLPPIGSKFFRQATLNEDHYYRLPDYKHIHFIDVNEHFENYMTENEAPAAKQALFIENTAPVLGYKEKMYLLFDKYKNDVISFENITGKLYELKENKNKLYLVVHGIDGKLYEFEDPDLSSLYITDEKLSAVSTFQLIEENK